MTRRSERNGPGYFGIGIERSKTPANVGTLWRSAYGLGAAFVFVIGRRYPRQASDTCHSWQHIPLYHYDDVGDFALHRPFDCPIIGIELLPTAHPLERFAHPAMAVYLLGPEDGTLSGQAQALCKEVVAFSSRHCLNVAEAGTIVMYDRQAKAIRASQQQRILP